MDLLKNKLDDEKITYEVFSPREIFLNINGVDFSIIYDKYFYQMKIFNYYPNFDSVEEVIDQIEDIIENETDYFDNLAYVDEDRIEDDESIVFEIIERLEKKAELRKIDGKSKRKKSSKKSSKKSRKKSRKKSSKKSRKKSRKNSRKKSRKS